MNQAKQIRLNEPTTQDVTFQVVFNGIRSDIPITEAKARLAALFKATLEQIDNLSAKPGHVVKKNCTPDIASMYQSAIEKAGGVCELVPEAGPVVPLEIDLPTVITQSPNPATLTQGAIPIPTPVQDAVIEHVEAIEIFVGKNFGYFREKWEIAKQKKSQNSWNWAAFLASGFWMAYRKMYLYSGIFIGALVLEQLCEYAFGFPSKLSNGVNLGIAVTFGLQGNAWYKLHAEKKVREITAINRPGQVKNELARQGGTSIGAAIGFGVALLVIGVLVAVVAEG